MAGGFRLRFRTWYGVLLALWGLIMGPLFMLALAYGTEKQDASWRIMGEVLADLFTPMGGDPVAILLFLFAWSPLLAAPFGLLARIPQE